MPVLQPNVTFQKSTEITKALRSRDASLLSLLPTARRVFEQADSHDISNSYFPRRNEWLLEWIVQRLKEDDISARDARRSPSTWTFVCDLLRAVNTTSLAGTLRRHGIIMSIGKMMKELRADSDVTSVSALLATVTQTLDCLKEISKMEISIMVALRISMETSATIMGDFLAVCEKLLDSVTVEESWSLAIVALWKTSVWGKSDSKKISAVWSEKCLCSATRLLASKNISALLRSNLENMISSCIFSPKVFISANATKSPETLLQLLAPLRQTQSTRHSQPSALAILFRIALLANSTEKSKPDPDLVALIFESLILSVEGLDLNASKIPPISQTAIVQISSLLDELTSFGASLPSSTMAQIAANVAGLDSTVAKDVRWDIVRSLLEIDFDTFLHPSHTKLTEELFAAISRSFPSQEQDAVLKLLLDGFVKARDLSGFVERWESELDSHPNSKVWTGDTLCEAYAVYVEASLIPAQIIRLLNRLWEVKQLVILDATMRGIHQPETETKLSGEALFTECVPFAVENRSDWRRWRLLSRLGSIQPELLSGAASTARKIIKNSKKGSVSVFAVEVLLEMNQQSDDVDITQSVIQTISAAWPDHQDWDGDLNSISKSTFAYVASLPIVHQHLELLEKVDSATRNSFIDQFLQTAFKSEQVRNLWVTMTENPDFYELASLKDATLAALLAAIKPYNDMAHHMDKAVAGPMPSSIDGMSRIQFVTSNIYKYPLETLKRQSREQVLNIAFLMHMTGQSSAVLPLVEKLWRKGNATAYMTTHAEAFRTYFVHSTATGPARQLLQHAVFNKDQDKVQEYLCDLIEMARGHIKDQPEMCTVIVTELWKLRAEKDINKAKALENIRSELMRLLHSKVSSAKALENLQDVDFWRQLWELERDNRDDALRFVTKLTGDVIRIPVEKLGQPVEVLNLLCAVSQSLEEITKTTAFILQTSRPLPEEQSSLVLFFYRSMTQRLDFNMQVEFTLWLTKGCASLPSSTAWPWKLLQEAISSLKKVPVSETGNIVESISSILHLLAVYLTQSASSEIMESICASLDSLLQSHASNLTQYDIESVLSALTLALSPRGPSFVASQPDSVYIALVRLLSTVLSLHRHRIRGRYHLTTELLQASLCCLFTSPLVRRKAQNAVSSRPPWLTGSVLSVTSARAFARVLHAFCEPPVSTVRTHGTELIDSQRAREKRCVSKAIGPVLDIYARQLLEAKIAVDMRKEVGVGIEAVLAVLGREGLQKIFAGMSTEGRAVVRSLWAAYSRGGRERV